MTQAGKSVVNNSADGVKRTGKRLLADELRRNPFWMPKVQTGLRSANLSGKRTEVW